VIAIAKGNGWLVYHAVPSMNQRGVWATHFRGHNGFPDLVLNHPVGDLVVVELKSEIGRVSEGQVRWLNSFAASGIETHVWRPEQLKDGTIQKRLATPIKK
jgi:hypothetical protein